MSQTFEFAGRLTGEFRFTTRSGDDSVHVDGPARKKTKPSTDTSPVPDTPEKLVKNPERTPEKVENTNNAGTTEFHAEGIWPKDRHWEHQHRFCKPFAKKPVCRSSAPPRCC